MKTGKSLVELAQEIERQANTKRDYLAPAGKLSAVVIPDSGPRTIQVNLAGQGSFPLTDYAHGQVAQYLEIPKAYYDRMRVQAPDLLASSFNRWIGDHQGEARMVRTLDGQVRAVLSDRYRPLDNIDLAEAVLPILKDLDLILLSTEITERRLYIKAVDRRIEKDLPEGFSMGDGSHHIFDTVSPAITISNSEIGAGTLAIAAGVWTKACTNLAEFGASMRKYHTGARADLSEEVYALLSSSTKVATDRALWMQTRDLVKAAFDEAKFEALTVKLIESRQDKIDPKADVVKVIEQAQRRFTWNDGERASVLTHLIKGGDLSRYGLHAAVTRASADVADYDRATEMERQGGQIIELPRHDWEEIAQAA